MIRRFWRSSGLPLDHIFGTAAGLYRRSRLRTALATWHSVAKAETHRINYRIEAAGVIQRATRVFIGRHTAERRRRVRGPAVLAASRIIQAEFRSWKARVKTADVAVRKKNRQELRERCWFDETAKDEQSRRDASTVIQAAWRGAAGRAVGLSRARRTLRGVLNELGGGRGRMHR
ncbi:unnamed protein product [Ectocarpus sp. 4 AP-2014]